MRRILVTVLVVAMLGCMPYTFFPENRDWFKLDVAGAEESNFGNARGFNWQDREYFGPAYTERQLGGDASTGDGGAAGDGGAGTGGNGDGCSK